MSNGIGKNPLLDISRVYQEQIATEGTMDIKGFEIPKKERESAAERIKKKTAEKKAALEKKHGMKMDDHPEYPKKKYVDENRRAAQPLVDIKTIQRNRPIPLRQVSLVSLVASQIS